MTLIICFFSQSPFKFTDFIFFHSKQSSNKFILICLPIFDDFLLLEHMFNPMFVLFKYVWCHSLCFKIWRFWGLSLKRIYLLFLSPHNNSKFACVCKCVFKNLSKLQERVEDRGAWHATIHRVTELDMT